MDLAWYLGYWLFELKQDEQSFWDRMNPARMFLLMRAYYKPLKARKEEDERRRGGNTKYVDFDVPAGNNAGLAAYMTKGR